MDAQRKKTLEDFMAAVPEEELKLEQPSDTISLDEPNRNVWIQILLYVIIFLMIGGVAYTGYRVYQSQNSVENKNKIEGSVVKDVDSRPLPKYIYINAEGGLNLRKEASAESESLGIIADKTKLEVIQEVNEWLKVVYQSQTGWIKKEFTTTP